MIIFYEQLVSQTSKIPFYFLFYLRMIVLYPFQVILSILSLLLPSLSTSHLSFTLRLNHFLYHQTPILLSSFILLCLRQSQSQGFIFFCQIVNQVQVCFLLHLNHCSYHVTISSELVGDNCKHLSLLRSLIHHVYQSRLNWVVAFFSTLQLLQKLGIIITNNNQFK